MHACTWHNPSPNPSSRVCVCVCVRMRMCVPCAVSLQVVTRHLTTAGLDVSGKMVDRIGRLTTLGQSTVQAAIRESAQVRAAKAAKKAGAAQAAKGEGAALGAKGVKVVAAKARAAVKAGAGGDDGDDEEEDGDDDDGDDDDDDNEEEEPVKRVAATSKHVLTLQRVDPEEKLGFVSDGDCEVGNPSTEPSPP